MAGELLESLVLAPEDLPVDLGASLLLGVVGLGLGKRELGRCNVHLLLRRSRLLVGDLELAEHDLQVSRARVGHARILVRLNLDRVCEIRTVLALLVVVLHRRVHGHLTFDNPLVGVVCGHDQVLEIVRGIRRQGLLDHALVLVQERDAQLRVGTACPIEVEELSVHRLHIGKCPHIVPVVGQWAAPQRAPHPARDDEPPDGGERRASGGRRQVDGSPGILAQKKKYLLTDHTHIHLLGVPSRYSRAVRNRITPSYRFFFERMAPYIYRWCRRWFQERRAESTPSRRSSDCGIEDR